MQCAAPSTSPACGLGLTLTRVRVRAMLTTGESRHVEIPNWALPSTLDNHGNYIISLGQLVRWLAEQAEELGVEVYPGFAADEVLYSADGAVRGIATKDVGIGKDGAPKDTFARGMELRGRQTLFAEGCRGSCSEDVIERFALREGKDMQTYGIGIKEVWEIPEAKFHEGLIQHSIGWPLKADTYGGTFLYHMAPNKVAVTQTMLANIVNESLLTWRMAPSQGAAGDGGRPRLQEPLSLTLPRVPALENAPGDQKAPGGRYLCVVWCACAQRRWSPGHPQVDLPRRRPHRLFGWLCQCAKGQRIAHSHEERDACSREHLLGTHGPV